MPTTAVTVVTVMAMTVVPMVPMGITMAVLCLNEIGGRRRCREIQRRRGERSRLYR
ncbi:MAG: hypothetical protein J0H17_22525 [Rhizobiales bacterium]|nr:hypothetical protein [Hyphomicrobiales bacterium]